MIVIDVRGDAPGGGANFDAPAFMTIMITRQKASSRGRCSPDGVGWTWVDTTRPGLDAMAEMSAGMIDLMRASHIAPRGFAKILLGGLDSYKSDKQAPTCSRTRTTS